MSEKTVIGNTTLINKDSLIGMMELPDNYFDLAIVDPPYGASTQFNWELIKNHDLKGFGGAWKLASHEWDMFSVDEYLQFTIAWLTQVSRLVKPTGSIWVHSTYHNSGFVNVVCQILKIEIINEVIWFKRNAFPNLSARRLTASHETIYWIHTGKAKREYRFNYDDVKNADFPEDSLKVQGKQLRTVWDIPNNKKPEELSQGSHPTQKPLRLLDRMFLISGIKGGKFLDPFMGSGSSLVSALNNGMKPTGFEINKEYFDIAAKRIKKCSENILPIQDIPEKSEEGQLRLLDGKKKYSTNNKVVRK